MGQFTAPQLEKFRRELEAITTTTLDNNFNEIDVKPTIIIRNGELLVSAEDGGFFADYYGEFRGNDPWIHPKLEEWAKKNRFYWEWDSPGALSLAY